MLDSLQTELDTTATAQSIRIVGIDAAGFESGNTAICAGRTLPWLQDTSGAKVWQAWGANTDDLIVLDSTNVVVTVYNLFDQLDASAHRTHVKNVLLSAAH